MNVTYWSNWYKRKNSTRQPNGGTVVSVSLKQPCSFWNPEIETTQIPRTANYFKIPADKFTQYDAYYFVDDVVSVTKDVTRFKLTFDPMGTYKSLISASWQYVLRANATATFNRWVTDAMNPPTADVRITYATTAIRFSYGGSNINLFDLTTWRYLLTVVGCNAYTGYQLSNGLSKTYVLSGGTMLMLNLKLNDSTFLENLVREMTNPLDAIISCKALPLNMSGLTFQNDEPIFFGSYSSTITANVLQDRVRIIETELTMPTSMTGQQSYLNAPPYVTATIYLPFVGVCPLDAEQITGRRVKLKTIVDNYTGDIIYEIKDYTYGYVYQSFTGNCATDCPISTGNYSASGLASGVLTTIGGIASQNPIMAAAGVMSAAQSLESHTQVNGGHSTAIGGWAGTDVVITCYKREPAHGLTDAAANEGLPYEKREMLGNLSGYVLCRNASIEIPGSDRDKEMINSYLNSGFFME